jgi:hypothetical protein
MQVRTGTILSILIALSGCDRVSPQHEAHLDACMRTIAEPDISACTEQCATLSGEPKRKEMRHCVDGCNLLTQRWIAKCNESATLPRSR